MSDILIVHQFENMIINVFGMHFDFIILLVSTIMEVPLLGVQIGPCLKCMLIFSRPSLRKVADSLQSLCDRINGRCINPENMRKAEW